ncbi:hypothetical protein SSAG_01242 [Streptomyces sp. Mg1]|nr:hypothetical protein SSAG_01242 [Streptomyces sp. Mg1]
MNKLKRWRGLARVTPVSWHAKGSPAIGSVVAVPGRLRRRDRNSHTKIISPVASSYGTTLTPA